MKKYDCSDLNTIFLKLRSSRGWTQSYVAHKIGLSQKNYSNLENGHTELTVKRFLQLTSVFDVNPAEIFSELLSGDSNCKEAVIQYKDPLTEIKRLEDQNKFLKNQNEFLMELCKRQAEKPCVNPEWKNQN